MTGADVNQVSTKLRRGQAEFFHWCPGCEEMHPLPDRGWTFNGSLEWPSFSPSFKHSYVRFDSYDERGVGHGERRIRVCHYILNDGMLNFCDDSYHALAGKSVPLPELPAILRD